METHNFKLVEEKHKKLIMNVLYFGFFCILFSGALVGWYSFKNHSYLKILNFSFSGIILEIIIISIGVRYLNFMTILKKDLIKNHYVFNSKSSCKEKKLSDKIRITR